MKRIKHFLSLTFVLLMVACNSKPTLDITEAEIDTYIEEKLDVSQIYDILVSLRYSNNTDTYEVVSYEQEDSLVLHFETYNDTEKSLNRSIFYKENLPVYIEEYEERIIDDGAPLKQRKIYLNGAEVIKAYQKEAATDIDLEQKEFKEYEEDIDNFDFQKPLDDLNQEGDFELAFEQYMQIGSSMWLVASNTQSGHNAALLVLMQDEFIDKTYSDPDAYVGKKVTIYHTFMNYDGVDQMIYEGGELKE